MITPRAPIHLDGTRIERVRASPERAVASLSRPDLVTAALDDLLDQGRSTLGPPVTWVLPRLTIAGIGLDTVLLPRWRVERRTVTIDAPSAAGSDTDVQLWLATRVGRATGTTLTTDWRLRVRTPLPPPLVRLARARLAATVGEVVDQVTARAAAAVDRRG